MHIPAEKALTSSHPVSHYDKPSVSFMVCGSVDNGKSTLLGRLLYECDSIYLDHIEAQLKNVNADHSNIDYSYFLDGLQDERAQNITIDVSYRYFKTDKRNFILLDTPGHTQYIKNMALAASKAQVAIVLVDIQEGITETLNTHMGICQLMGIKHFIICINKIDLESYNESTYRSLVKKIKSKYENSKIADFMFIPLSAINAVNLTENSKETPWYKGLPLIKLMESTVITEADGDNKFCMPVQYVARDLSKKFRGYSGLSGKGVISIGDELRILPSNQNCTVKAIYEGGEAVERSSPELSTLLTLKENVDISRGDLLVDSSAKISEYNQFKVKILWFDDHSPLLKSKKYIFKNHHNQIPGMVTKFKTLLTFESSSTNFVDKIQCNEIASCDIYLDKKIPYLPYTQEPALGSFIIIDRLTFETVGIAVIEHELDKSNNIFPQSSGKISKAERSQIKGQKPFVIWLTGLSGSGKTTIANLLEKKLLDQGFHTYILDGDNIRSGLSLDLGFQDSDRIENMRRIGEISKLFLDAGIITIVSMISPFRKEREDIKQSIGTEDFIEIFVNASLEKCIERDVKGLYKKQKAGHARNFTGIDSQYEAPHNPDLKLDSDSKTPTQLLDELISYLIRKKMIEGNL